MSDVALPLTVQQRIARLYFERNRRYAALPLARVILNIGCGSGSFPKFYPHVSVVMFHLDVGEERSGYPAFGVNRKGMAGTRSALAERPGHVFIDGDLRDIMCRFPSATFDMVVAGQVIEHLPECDTEVLLAEAWRLLGPQGLLQIDTLPPELGEVVPEHQQHFTPTMLESIVERFDFRTVVVESFAEGAGTWGLFRKEE